MTDRRAMRLAQVIQMAMREDAQGAQRDYPETVYAQPRPRRPSKRVVILGVIAGGLVLAGGIWAGGIWGPNRRGARKRLGRLWG